MALSGKLESVVDTKPSADTFFNFLCSQTHAWPTASSERVQGVEVHEGDWETSGSVKLWKYTCEGKEEVFKERVEVDKENKLVSLTAVGGHCLDEYKSYKIIFQVSPKSEGSSVKITIHYEKHHQDIPPPNKYLNFLVGLIRDMDAHLTKA